MGDMDERTGADGGPDEHLADAGGPVAGTGSAGSTGPDDDGPLIDADQEPRLAAFLERSNEVLRTGPDEFTARRHLTAMQREAAVGRGHTGLRVASIAAAAAVAAAVTLAGFGALPAPAQQLMSDMAERLGVTIPSPAVDGPPATEHPVEQQPAPESVPDPPGGPDRSELPGGRGEGQPDAPGSSEDVTPFGQRDGEAPPPGLDEDFVPPGPHREPGAPDGLPAEPRGNQDEVPGPPDDPPGTVPQERPDPPEEPARGQRSNPGEDAADGSEDPPADVVDPSGKPDTAHDASSPSGTSDPGP